MRLRGAELDPSADLRRGLGNGEASTQEVDPTNPERGHLAEAQSRVGEKTNGVCVIAGCACELLDLVMGKEPRLAPRHSWQRYAVGGVARDAPVAHREAKEEREHS